MIRIMKEIGAPREKLKAVIFHLFSFIKEYLSWLYFSKTKS